MPGTIERAPETSARLAARGARLLAGRGVRRAWLIVASLLAVPILALGVTQAASALAHEERTEVREVAAGDVTGLVVDNEAGTVRVLGVEGADTVVVRARISDGLRDTGHEISRRDDALVVRGSCPLWGSSWCEVDYTIEVPAAMYIDVEADGRVTISDVTGGVVASSNQSPVELARVGGDVTVSADQGRIEGTDLTADHVTARANQGRLTLEFAESPRSVEASANQGSLDIVLPDDDDVAYATETSANQGTVSDRIRQDPGSDRSITAEANQGSITIAYVTS
jgi:hypothetical protein